MITSVSSVKSGIGEGLPGLLLVVCIATAAMVFGHWLPVIGAPVFGIVLGILVRSLFNPGESLNPGIGFAAKQILQWSIVALGLGLSLTQVARTGVQSLSVTAVTMTTAFVTAMLLGRWLGVHDKLKTLIGVGTAICGGSAIAATVPIIKPKDHDTAYAISTIFLFNVVAVLLFPLLGHLLHLSDKGFGMWAGTAINDTSSVVAAGYSFSKSAGDFATIVKLTRATLIIPVCLVLAIIEAARHKRSGAEDFSLARIFPWFILWFLVASGLRTAGLIPTAWEGDIHAGAGFLIVVALTGVGLSSNLRSMASTGFRPILLGLGVWVSVASSSLAVQYLMGHW